MSTSEESTFKTNPADNGLKESSKRPNIIFILADDVGWNDWSFNNAASPIPTPNIDALAAEGIQLKQHYMHSLCTPSRAALMTGRYHINTGLTYVLAPATPAGLPEEIPTLPQLLKSQANYTTAMVGKWHLGHAQQKQTPTGRGFQTFTGIYMWDTDSYTKQMHEVPWEEPMMIDWVSESDTAGDFKHYAEPRHATEAITQEAEDVIRRHSSASTDEPLFLYVAYTAAHSPLQALSRHEPPCAHLPHLWRRQFCGMVLGLDEGIGNLTRTARSVLGENTLVVVTSDNGGSPWFGGNNTPLRGSKATPYEGGVRVPGFIVDFSSNQAYLGGQSGTQGRVFNGLMHVSDWAPTLLSYAGVNVESLEQVGFDGKDFSSAFQTLTVSENASSAPVTYEPRDEVLLELYLSSEFIFGETLAAYRVGDFKLIEGIVRDENYYYEATTTGKDRMHLSNPTWITFLAENVNRFFDMLFGHNHNDIFRITITHMFLQGEMTRAQKAGVAPTVRLFNLATDPNETTNLAELPEYSAKIAEIRERIATTQENRKYAALPTHVIYPIDKWAETHVSGDCSMHPTLKDLPKQCRFTHPWIDNSVKDVFASKDLISASKYTTQRVQQTLVWRVVLIVLFIVMLLRQLAHRLFGGKGASEGDQQGEKKKSKKSKKDE